MYPNPAGTFRINHTIINEKYAAYEIIDSSSFKGHVGQNNTTSKMRNCHCLRSFQQSSVYTIAILQKIATLRNSATLRQIATLRNEFYGKSDPDLNGRRHLSGGIVAGNFVAQRLFDDFNGPRNEQNHIIRWSKRNNSSHAPDFVFC